MALLPSQCVHHACWSQLGSLVRMLQCVVLCQHVVGWALCCAVLRCADCCAQPDCCALACLPPQVPVDRPTFQESTSLGAALAAGLAVGLWSQAQVFHQPANNKRRFMPMVSDTNANRRYAKWQKAVSRCLDLADLAEEEEQEGAGSLAGAVAEVQ